MPINKDNLLRLLKQYISGDEIEKSKAQKEIALLLQEKPSDLINTIKDLIKQEGYRKIGLGKELVVFGDYAWNAILQVADETNDKNVGWAVAWTISDFTEVCSIDDYIDAFSHKNVHVRWSAALNISKFNDPRAIEPLLELFHEPDDIQTKSKTVGYITNYHAKVRHCAGLSLRELRHFDLERILEKVNDPNPLVREAVANALIGSTDLRAVQPISQLLEDPDMLVRRRALEALETLVVADLDNPQLLDSLLHQLHVDEQWVQVYAGKPIAKYGSKVVPQLLGIANSADLDLQNRYTRYYALNPITRMLWDKIDIEDMYTELTSSLSNLLTDETKRDNYLVRLEIVNILGEIGDDYSISLLIDAMQDDNPYVLQAVIEGVAKTKSEEVLSALRVLHRKWENVTDSEDSEDSPIEDLKWGIESTIEDMSRENGDDST